MLDITNGICYCNLASMTCVNFFYLSKMIVESGEQSGLYLIQRGTVRKQIKLATIVVFVSLPGEKEQTFYIVLIKAQELLEPFHVEDKN